MPIPDGTPRAETTEGFARRGASTTTLLTLLLAALLAGGVAIGRIPVRDASGTWRVRRVAEVWGAMLENLPAGAPAFLGREVLLVGIVIAVLAGAYAIVATLRLPQ
jgi:hypothetical protein